MDEVAGTADLLIQREVCREGTLDEFRAQLNSFFYPARVETARRTSVLRTSRLSAARLSNITLGFVRFGSEAMVDPGALGAYHVNIPLAGQIVSECGKRQVVATTTTGAVFTPREHTVLPSWSEDAAQVCVKMNKSAVDAELEALLGRPIGRDVQFGLAFDLTTPAAASWLATLRLVIEELDRPGGLLERSPRHRDYLEKALIAGLLHSQRHDHLEELLSPTPPARPRTVKRVVDLIDAHPELNYPLSDLARHSGVGARRLQAAFQEALDMTPSGYLRKVKLERARADLRSGEAENVATVAYRWGFNHPGRFAALYRRAFGESPAQTLKGARA
ncbi:MAG TPA: AraC family transcriptional regulator [Pseudonocardia sp.]|jgi:AraC-like DNA-binding protein|nr:AraC family transcriptional regulator [Pseudonocardia sp.]